MKELIKKLEDDHGLTEENATDILNTIKNYIREKFPMISGAVDNLFQTEATASNKTPSASQDRSPDMEDFLD